MQVQEIPVPSLQLVSRGARVSASATTLSREMGQSSGGSGLLHDVVEVLASADTPLKARDIAARLRRQEDPSELRREVNQLLYGPLAAFVSKDSSDGWKLDRTPTFPAPRQRGSRQGGAIPVSKGEQLTAAPEDVSMSDSRPLDPDVLQRITATLNAWKKELIAFGRQNKVLYFNSTRRTRLKLSAPDVSRLYEALVLRDKALTFGTPARGDIDRAELEDDSGPREDIRERHGDLQVDYFSSSAVDVRSLQRKLFRLRTDARTTLNEQGINTLHVALGILRWREADSSQEWVESPILLVPAALDRERNGPYRLSGFEGDVVVNPALKYRLRHDFDVELPPFDPYDGFGEDADIPGYLLAVGELGRDRGWTVQSDSWLSHFSFEKLVMYEDLSAAGTGEDVARHPVLAAICDIAHLDAPEVSFEDLDARYELPDTFPVVDADSSQLEVIARARAGQSLVVQGPPGTGKSQTIVNLVGQAIRDGKSVLFVSEKRAALEVVHRRLRDAGLADLCLDLSPATSGCATTKWTPPG